MTSGKPLIYPEIVHLFDVMRQIGRACGKGPRRPARVTAATAATSRYSFS